MVSTSKFYLVRRKSVSSKELSLAYLDCLDRTDECDISRILWRLENRGWASLILAVYRKLGALIELVLLIQD